MNYTYTLDGTTVNPEGDWRVDYSRNAGQIFFRRTMTGEMIFKGDDYDFITSQSECTDMTLKIYCKGVEWWEGTIKYPYGFEEIDEDSCFIKGTPIVEDEYTCVMKDYETEWFIEEFMTSLPIAGAYPVCNFATCPGGAGAVGVTRQAVSIYWFLSTLFQGVHPTSGIKFMDCSYTLKSSFLWEDNFPNGTNYAGAYGVNNYITGAANVLDKVLFVSNTIVRQDWGVAADACPEQTDTIGFRFIESVLRDRFNAYWYIDQNDEFRIEHIHFFDEDFPESDYQDGIDLTTTIGSSGRTFAYRKNKFSYLTDELFDQEDWEWQHYWGTEGAVAHGTDFQGVPIFYGTDFNTKYECVPGEFKVKKVSTPQLWTDLCWGWQLANVQDIACGGWLMLVTDWNLVAAACNVVTEQGAYSGGAAVTNGHLSTANLQEHYFTYNRIFLNGHMNNGATPPATETTVFDTEIRKLLQTEIEFPWCCDGDFDPLDFIVTEEGSGQVESAVIDSNRHSLIVELKY